MPWPVMLKQLKLNSSMKTYKPSRTNTQKRCPFHYRGLECKSTKSKNSGSNRQFSLGVQNEAGQKLTEFCQENTLVKTNTLFQQHKRQLYTWTSPDGQYRNQIDWLYSLQSKMEEFYKVSKSKTWSWLWLRSWAPYCKIQTYIEESRENH